jgi:hypothetical protein
MIKNRTDIIICDCHSLQHQMIIRTDRFDGDWPWDSTEITLLTKRFSFLERLKVGIKYIFGLLNYNEDYMFTEIVINKIEAQKIIDHLTKEVIENGNDFTCSYCSEEETKN